MTAARRVLSAATILGLLAFNLACPSPPAMPETQLCDGAPAEAAIDGVAVSAHFERGGQGTLMVVARVEWLGAEAPACANVDVRLLDQSGESLRSRSAALETEPSDGGRRATSSMYFLVDDGLCRAVVEVESYGHTDRVEAVDTDGYCPQPDGGLGDAG